MEMVIIRFSHCDCDFNGRIDVKYFLKLYFTFIHGLAVTSTPDVFKHENL